MSRRSAHLNRIRTRKAEGPFKAEVQLKTQRPVATQNDPTSCRAPASRRHQLGATRRSNEENSRDQTIGG